MWVPRDAVYQDENTEVSLQRRIGKEADDRIVDLFERARTRWGRYGTREKQGMKTVGPR